MWKFFFIFLVVIPGAFLTMMLVYLRKWRSYPVGKVDVIKAERAEEERIRESLKELKRMGWKQKTPH